MEANNTTIKDALILEVLGGLYRAERLLSISTKELKNMNELEVTFHFPSYTKSLHPLGHTSANQIDEAVMEGIYLIIGYAAKNNQLAHISFQDFIDLRYPAIFREKHIKFKKELTDAAKENPTLIFSLGAITNVRNKFLTVVVHFQGFCEGNAKVCINLPEFVRAQINKNI